MGSQVRVIVSTPTESDGVRTPCFYWTGKKNPKEKGWVRIETKDPDLNERFEVYEIKAGTADSVGIADDPFCLNVFVHASADFVTAMKDVKEFKVLPSRRP